MVKHLHNIEKSPSKIQKEFLVCVLGEEEYAIDILYVQEIIWLSKPIQSVPNTPVHIKGVIEIHGKIVPVIDLRIFYHLPIPDVMAPSIVIIVTIQNNVLGIIVHSVADIVTLDPTSIQDTPNISSIINKNNVEGIYLLGERFFFCSTLKSSYRVRKWGF